MGPQDHQVSRSAQGRLKKLLWSDRQSLHFVNNRRQPGRRTVVVLLPHGYMVVTAKTMEKKEKKMSQELKRHVNYNFITKFLVCQEEIVMQKE